MITVEKVLVVKPGSPPHAQVRLSNGTVKWVRLVMGDSGWSVYLHDLLGEATDTEGNET